MMRTICVLGLGAMLALAGCDRKEEQAAPSDAGGGAAEAPAAGASADGAMQIQPGLWRVTSEGPGGVNQTQENCVTPEDARFDPSKAQPMPQSCTHTVARDGPATVVRTACPGVEGVGKMEMEMRATSNARTSYRVDMVTKLDTPQGPQSFSTSMTGAYVGPCPAG